MIRLYLDGVLMDVDEKTEVTLTINSNLLSDVTKLQSNNTLTIHLPKTTHNQSVISHADRIHGGGEYPNEWHKVDFFRNGVQLIKGGKAVLLAMGEDIEISIIWGLLPAFATLSESALTLNQLETNARLQVTYSQTADTYLDAQAADYFFADFDERYIEDAPDTSWHQDVNVTTSNGQTPADGGGHRRPSGTASGFNNLGDKIYLHPSVKVSWLLDLVAAQTGVTFQWSGDAADYIDTLILPLIKRKANELSYDNGFTGTLPTANAAGALNITITNPSNEFSEQSGAVAQLTAVADAELYVDIKAAYHADGITFSGSETMKAFYPMYCEVSVNEFGQDPVTYIVGINRRAPNNKISKYNVTTAGRYREEIFGNGRISVEQGQNIKVALKLTDDLGYTYAFEGGNITIDLAGATDEVTNGLYFPIAENLPEIKVLDLVKTLCVLTGTYPLQTSGSVVTFVPYSTLADNIAYAVDWSSRLMPAEKRNKPREMSYKVDDWAQVNFYKWKEDSTITTNFDASITIGDETLDAERDVITLPFAATENNVIPIYTLSDDGKVSYKACQPRILRLAEGSNGEAVGVFDIDLGAILADLHSPLLQMLQNARVVTEYFALSDVDILNFDETKPVFIRQYGAYFAVTKITAKDNGIAEVKMMMINL